MLFYKILFHNKIKHLIFIESKILLVYMVTFVKIITINLTRQLHMRL